MILHHPPSFVCIMNVPIKKDFFGFTFYSGYWVNSRADIDALLCNSLSQTRDCLPLPPARCGRGCKNFLKSNVCTTLSGSGFPERLTRVRSTISTDDTIFFGSERNKKHNPVNAYHSEKVVNKAWIIITPEMIPNAQWKCVHRILVMFGFRVIVRVLRSLRLLMR